MVGGRFGQGLWIMNSVPPQGVSVCSAASWAAVAVDGAMRSDGICASGASISSFTPGTRPGGETDPDIAASHPRTLGAALLLRGRGPRSSGTQSWFSGRASARGRAGACRRTRGGCSYLCESRGRIGQTWRERLSVIGEIGSPLIGVLTNCRFFSAPMIL